MQGPNLREEMPVKALPESCIRKPGARERWHGRSDAIYHDSTESARTLEKLKENTHRSTTRILYNIIFKQYLKGVSLL